MTVVEEAHSLTLSLTHSLTRSLAHSIIKSGSRTPTLNPKPQTLNQALQTAQIVGMTVVEEAHSFNHSLTLHSLTHSLTHSLNQTCRTPTLKPQPSTLKQALQTAQIVNMTVVEEAEARKHWAGDMYYVDGGVLQFDIEHWMEQKHETIYNAQDVEVPFRVKRGRIYINIY